MGIQPVEPEHEGEMYLRLLDMGHLASEPIQLQDGSSILARDFLDVCRNKALPTLIGFASLQPDHPKYAEYRTNLRTVIYGYLGIEPAS